MYPRQAYPLNHEINIGQLIENSKFYKKLKNQHFMNLCYEQLFITTDL